MSAVVTKAIAEIQPGSDDSETPNGTFDVILSAETLDRDGDTLKRDEWKTPLPDHITFDTDHGMSVDTTVGSGSPRIEDDGTLRVTGTYSSIPRAQEVRTLVNEGHIRTTSVAFLTEKPTKGATGAVTRELLNGAFVAIPSNREAVVLSSKGFDAIERETKEGRRNSTSDAENLQAAHDALVSAGATCEGTEKTAHRAETKSIVGSVEALQDRITDALQEALPLFSWLRGVVPADAGGIAYYDAYTDDDPKTYATESYSQAYTDDGSTVTLTGEASKIDINEIATPEAKSLTVSDPANAGSDTTSDIDLQLRAAAIRANTALL